MKNILTNILIYTLLLFGKNLYSNSIEFDKYLSLASDNDSSIHKGLAGCYAGIINNNLFIAGGANFPDALPWEGGTKTWYKGIYKIDLESNRCKKINAQLSTPSAYGKAITTSQGIIFIGGNNSKESLSEVKIMSINKKGDIIWKKLPSLPHALSNFSACILDDNIYIAGGQNSMQNPKSLKLFWTLNLKKLNQPDLKWKQLPNWEGESRAYSSMAVQNDGKEKCIFLFGGRSYGPNSSTKVLDDIHKYIPSQKKWVKISNTFKFMAGDCIGIGNEHIVFTHGTNGQMMNKELEIKALISSSKTTQEKNKYQQKLLEHLNNHQGFQSKIFSYNTITNEFNKVGKIKGDGVVTAPVVKRKNELYIISGEIKPGVRTPLILKAKVKEKNQQFGTLNTIVLIAYFLILLGMGIFFSNRQKNTDDYFKGGGRVPWWAAGLSIFGTALSAITFMAIPAKAYATDWSYIWLNVAVLISAPIVLYFFIPLYRKLNITTAYEYLEKRFSLSLRLMGSTSFIVFQIGRMAVVLFLPAIALNIVTGIDIYICIISMGILSLVYTFMGGIEAVIWTDAMQVIVLLGGAILSLVLISINIDGGIGNIITTGFNNDKFLPLNFNFDIGQSGFWIIIIGGLFSQFATYGADQTMVQRYLTTPSLKEAKKSLWTNILMTIPASILFFLIGTALYVFYKQNPSLVNLNLNNGDAIFPWYIVNELPNGVVGLLISGIFAAAMSSVSSSINSAATSYATDFHFRLFSNKNQMLIAKLATIIFGLLGTTIAIIMASSGVNSLWDTFNTIIGLIIGSMSGLFVLGAMFKKVDAFSAKLGFIGSVFVQIYVSMFTQTHFLIYTATGMLSCLFLALLINLIRKQTV